MVESVFICVPILIIPVDTFVYKFAVDDEFTATILFVVSVDAFNVLTFSVPILTEDIFTVLTLMRDEFIDTLDINGTDKEDEATVALSK